MANSREAFIQMLLPAAVEASKRTGIDPRIIVAQAAQETGWGRSAPGNNYFGIKSHGQGGGQTFTTHEVINGQRVKMNDSFRQFGSPAESVAGYADFMTQNKRYAPMRQAQGLDAQLQALGRSGYATDPNYSQSVGAIARQIPLDGGASLSPAAADFVQNNPQPGGFGPAVEQAAGIATPAPATAPFGTMAPRPSDTSIDPGVANYWNNMPGDGEKKDTLGNRLANAGKAFDDAIMPAPRHGQLPGGPSAEQATGLLKATGNIDQLAKMLFQRRMG